MQLGGPAAGGGGKLGHASSGLAWIAWLTWAMDRCAHTCTRSSTNWVACACMGKLDHHSCELSLHAHAHETWLWKGHGPGGWGPLYYRILCAMLSSSILQLNRRWIWKTIAWDIQPLGICIILNVYNLIYIHSSVITFVTMPLLIIVKRGFLCFFVKNWQISS